MGKASGSPKNPLQKEQVDNNAIEDKKAPTNNHIIPANTFAQADTGGVMLDNSNSTQLSLAVSLATNLTPPPLPIPPGWSTD